MDWQFDKPLILILTISAGSMMVYTETLSAGVVPGDCPLESPIVIEDGGSKEIVVNNKIKLLDAIVNYSRTAKRIEMSNNSEAIELLQNARSSLVHSRALYEKACMEASEQELNSGLKMVETASRLVVDNQRLDMIARQRHENLHAEVNSFLDAYERIAREKNVSPDSFLDLESFHVLLDKSEQLVRSGDYEEANRSMNKAAEMIATALVLIRNQETLKYELEFATAEDEFNYGMKTNLSYRKLLNMVLENRELATPVRVSIESLVKRNEELCSMADTNLSAGNSEAAIHNLDEGTEMLIRALRYTGIGM